MAHTPHTAPTNADQEIAQGLLTSDARGFMWKRKALSRLMRNWITPEWLERRPHLFGVRGGLPAVVRELFCPAMMGAEYWRFTSAHDFLYTAYANASLLFTAEKPLILIEILTIFRRLATHMARHPQLSNMSRIKGRYLCFARRPKGSCCS